MFTCFYKHPHSFNFSLPLLCKQRILHPRVGPRCHLPTAAHTECRSLVPFQEQISPLIALLLLSYRPTVTQSANLPLQVCEKSPWGHLILRNHSSLHCMRGCMLGHFSCERLFVTLWTIAHQAPLSMGFSRQEYWSGLPCSPPGDLPNLGMEPRSPALQADSLSAEPLGKLSIKCCQYCCLENRVASIILN